MRSLLIVAETTLAVVLLVGAGLLARSFERLLSVDLGFIRGGGADVRHLAAEQHAIQQPLQRQAFVEDVWRAPRRFRTSNRRAPCSACRCRISGYGISTSTRDGVTLSDDEQDGLTLQVRLVTPDYFKTMGIPIVKGRGFTAGDRMGSQLVAMLNQTGAARVWPDQDAMGHHSRSARGSALAARAPAAR